MTGVIPKNWHPAWLWGLAVVQGLVIWPLFPYVPAWVTMAATSAIVVRLWLPENANLLKLRWLHGLLASVGGVAVFIHFGTLLSRDAGLSLFVLMTCLKLFEIRHRRAAANSLFMAFFLLAVGFLYDQSLLQTFYALAVVVVLFAVLHVVNKQEQEQEQEQRWLPSIALAVRSVAMALPLAAALFVLFPRLSEPLWNMPGPKSGSTGVSDEMTPGDISSLVLSDNPAFRVRFYEKQPRPQAMYWRGLVLSKFDGLTWTRLPTAEQVELDNKGEFVRYQVVLEPTRERWLYALDLPWTIRGKRLFGETLEPVTKGRQTLRTTYDAVSLNKAVYQPRLSDALRERYTALPARGNARARQWAQERRSQMATDEGFVQSLMQWIHEENFYYTLNPPLLRQDTVDDFWFNQRKGFCEHYASAFVFLARAAGIPARVVVGYLGGERNPFTGDWQVRQSDAHAWTEIWLPKQGWLRFDPTAAIHPMRIDASVREVLGRRASLLTGDGGAVLADSVWKRLRFMWDAANSRWQDWVAGFDQSKQKLVLSWLGLDVRDWWSWVMAAIAVPAGIGFLWWVMLLPTKPKPHPVVRLYLDALRLAQAKGHPKASHEGPLAFLERLHKSNPSLARQLRPVVETYVHWRFGNAHIRASDLVRLRRHLKT